MMKIFRSYFKIIGYVLTGLAFGFSFFYLFLNFYHYQEIRRNVYIDFSTDNSIKKLNDTLDRIETNVEKLNVPTYRGNISISQAISWQSKMRTCISHFDTETLKSVKEDNIVDIKDVYNLRNEYESQILNSCLVYNLYSLILENGPDSAVLDENKKVFEYYLDDLLEDTSYLKKDLNNNGSYFFNTDSAIFSVQNPTRDGFYEVIASMNRTANFLELVSEWYLIEIGGAR